MTERLRAARAVVLLALCLVASSAPASAGPARDYVRYAVRLTIRMQRLLPSMTRAAEAAAERVVAGGRLHLAGSDTGFISEAAGRAGGLMMVEGLPNPEQATRADVVLIAPQPADAELCRRLRASGALVVAFGGSSDGAADHAIPGLAAPGNGLFRTRDGTLICPTSTISNVMALWAWTGEFVAACTRLGKMPTMWQSIWAPGGRERNAPLQGLRFHPQSEVKPVGRGVLGRAYLRELGARLRRLDRDEVPKLERIAALLDETRRSGRKAHLWMMGHLPPYVVGGPGDPGYFRIIPDAVPAEPDIAAGDLVVALGYTGVWEPLLKAVEKAGARAAWIIAPSGSLEAARQRGDILVDQQWRPGDAIVAVPGYDVRILPPSAVTQLVCYWAIVGEAAGREGRR